jgi:hypothetical protein
MKKKAQNLIEITSLLVLVVVIAFGVMTGFNKIKTKLVDLSKVTVTTETAGVPGASSTESGSGVTQNSLIEIAGTSSTTETAGETAK